MEIGDKIVKLFDKYSELPRYIRALILLVVGILGVALILAIMFSIVVGFGHIVDKYPWSPLLLIFGFIYLIIYKEIE